MGIANYAKKAENSDFFLENYMMKLQSTRKVFLKGARARRRHKPTVKRREMQKEKYF